MRKRAKIGDIFTQELESGEFMFGRVLMDIETQCFKSKKVTMDKSNLKNFSISYVVEAYDVVASSPDLPKDFKTVIPGIVVNPMAFKYDTWKVIGNVPLESPELVDFQEHCSFHDGKLFFSRGEVYLEGSLRDKELESIDTGYQINSPILFDLVKELQSTPPNPSALLRYDFRYLSKELRERIYAAIGEDPNMSYFELAKNHGFDTSRFF